jgi:hypothetical protein
MTSKRHATHRAGVLASLIALCAASLGSACLPTAASAQEDDKVKAKQSFQQGVAQYQAAHYEDALASFQEAYRLKPHPLVRVNIANCYDRLDRPVEAILHFELFLESKEGSPDQRSEVKNALKELHKRAGKLSLNLSPDGARVAIDDGDERRAPIAEAVLLKAGKHKVVVKLDGYETATRDIDVKGDSLTELSLRLSRATAAVATAADAPIPTLSIEGATEEPAADEKAEPDEEEKPDTQVAHAEPTEPTSEDADARHSIPVSVWIAGGTTVALAAAGTITGLLALRARDDFNANLAARFDDRLTVPQQAIAWQNATTASDRAHALAITTDVLFGAAVVGAVVTTYLLLSRDKQQSPTALAPSVHPHGGALVLCGSF